ncbi:MAG: radical SAM protein [archaeon]
MQLRRRRDFELRKNQQPGIREHREGEDEIVHCLLVQSPGQDIRKRKVFPLNLCYIGTALENAGHTVEIFDMNVAEDPFGGLRRKAGDGFDVIGVSLRNADSQTENLFIRNRNIFWFYKAVKLIKENSNAILIAGGSGFTLFSREIMEKTGIDFGIIGEGERSVCELLENLRDPGSVRGICYRKNRRVVFTRPASAIHDIDGPVKRDFPGIRLSRYTDHGVQTRRGCRYKCTYCTYSNIQNAEVRYRDPAAVADEVEELAGHGIRKAWFADCIFGDNKRQLRGICKGIAARNLDVSWATYMRADHADRESISLMKRSGCSYLEFSPDAGSQRTLDMLKKEITVGQIIDCAKKTRELNTGFMFFLNPPGETVSTLSETLRLAAKISSPGRRVLFGLIRIYPHTELYEQAVREGIVRPGTNLLEKMQFYNPGPLRYPVMGFLPVYGAYYWLRHARGEHF